MNYFDNPAMSQSKLKDLKRSPRHFWAKHIAKLTNEKDTDAMRFGRLLHLYIFEPQKFKDSFVVIPNIDRRTKKGKDEYNELVKNSIDKIVITDSEIWTLKEIKESILNKKTAKILLKNGLAEHELYWTDEDTQVNCKAKLDYFIEPCDLYPNGLVIDLKTTQNASVEEFSKTIYNFGYYHQVAFYCSAVKQIYKTDDYPAFIFMSAEKEAPYECAFFTADQVTLNIGLSENENLLRLYRECVQNDRWFGYEDKVNEISLPQWAINKFNSTADQSFL